MQECKVCRYLVEKDGWGWGAFGPVKKMRASLWGMEGRVEYPTSEGIRLEPWSHFKFHTQEEKSSIHSSTHPFIHLSYRLTVTSSAVLYDAGTHKPQAAMSSRQGISLYLQDQSLPIDKLS